MRRSIRVARLKARMRAVKSNALTSKSLAEAEFEALSYVWGIDLIPCTIQVNGKPSNVTRNLYQAVQELQDANDDRNLWVDAMSINQHDNVEKSTRVQLMRGIYTKAKRVMIWLGTGNDTIRSALETM